MSADIGRVIDCHGHYTTAPPALEAWRQRQIAALDDPSRGPRASDLHISDDELRERRRGADPHPEGRGHGARIVCLQHSRSTRHLSALGVRREKAALSSGCESHPATAPAGSNRSRHGGDEMSEAFG